MLHRLLILCPLLGLGFLSNATYASDPVVIVSPTEGSVLPSQFMVNVSHGLITVCHYTGDSSEICSDEPVERIELSASNADFLELWACQPCTKDVAIFDLTLPPGQYELAAKAVANIAYESSNVVNVTVKEEATSGGVSTESGATATDAGITSGGVTNTDSESATTDGKTIKNEGCACESSNDTPDGFEWLAAVFLAVRRRRLQIRAN